MSGLCGLLREVESATTAAEAERDDLVARAAAVVDLILGAVSA